jgi:hypothetical protein
VAVPTPEGDVTPKEPLTTALTDQKLAGLPGTVCFPSEAALFEHFGKDPDRPFCARTDTNPGSLNEVLLVSV